MKKAYNTPKIYIERFEMTEHIADCGATTQKNPNDFGRPNATNTNMCEFVTNDGLTKLFGTLDHCTEEFNEMWEQMIGCYNSPTGENIIFSS